ncbi:methylated-DNA--[protein]-cysteine S-methyltransferase [Rhodospirillaceae bacterium SYSU D60014]|uniref:methylated-DNA--[protein]-cysteine S-methyltransferase n=1 Tax=Virgifigura deserti TaxID=2268457 RepID=UPI000E675562
MTRAQTTVATPLGPLTVTQRGEAIVALDWGAADAEAETPLLAAAAQQIASYFDRELTEFELPLAPAGSPFEQEVWAAMRRVPYGTTQRYGEVARLLRSMPRAVGVACGRNPIPIIIPCHRIVGTSTSGNRLGGYSGHGGPETKQFLLGLEGAALPLGPPRARSDQVGST